MTEIRPWISDKMSPTYFRASAHASSYGVHGSQASGSSAGNWSEAYKDAEDILKREFVVLEAPEESLQP